MKIYKCKTFNFSCARTIVTTCLFHKKNLPFYSQLLSYKITWGKSKCQFLSRYDKCVLLIEFRIINMQSWSNFLAVKKFKLFYAHVLLYIELFLKNEITKMTKISCCFLFYFEGPFYLRKKRMAFQMRAQNELKSYTI